MQLGLKVLHPILTAEWCCDADVDACAADSFDACDACDADSFDACAADACAASNNHLCTGK